MKKTLVEFEAWSVCETDEYEDPAGNVITQVYGEHYRDCKEDEDIGEACWSWEYDDAPDNGRDVCWKCGGTVPDEVVAIVQLHNWGKKHRGIE